MTKVFIIFLRLKKHRHLKDVGILLENNQKKNDTVDLYHIVNIFKLKSLFINFRF